MDLFENSDSAPPFQMPGGREFSAHWIDDLGGYRLLVPNGELVYIEHFFDQKVSDRSFEYFQEHDAFDWQRASRGNGPAEKLSPTRYTNINWEQESIRLYGKAIALPRLTAWYGDSGTSYTYSGITSRPNEWNKGLLVLKRQIEAWAGVEFNSVLLNWYRDGQDHLNWHADDEKELGANPVIASANFGATRDFLFRRNDDKSVKIILPLKHGTLLLMRGGLQHFWQHSVPKRKRVKGARFNLTFRRILIGQAD